MQSITQCCAILCSRSLLTKQFSPIKAKIFSIAIFTSVQEFKVNGYLRKSILGNYFLYLEKIEIMAEEVDQTKHQFVKRRHEEDEKTVEKLETQIFSQRVFDC